MVDPMVEVYTYIHQSNHTPRPWGQPWGHDLDHGVNHEELKIGLKLAYIQAFWACFQLDSSNIG